MTSLPAQIGNLKSLTELDCTGCMLKSIPKDLWRLRGLKFLALEGSFRKFPTQPADWPQLERLRIRGKLREIPEWLLSLPRLRELDLTGNHIKEMPDSMVFPPTLRVLRLDGNPITRLPKGFLDMPKGLKFSAVGCGASKPQMLAALRG